MDNKRKIMYNQASSCEAAICVKRNRVKVFGDTTYLKGHQEFEIELFNPTQSTVLAKIQISGKYISQAGIVLKPGQRIYLERYIDEAKKFLFDTYEVEKGNAQVDNAISKNGVVRVEFYNEYIPMQQIQPIWTNPLYSYTTLGNTITSTPRTFTSNTNLSGSNASFFSQSIPTNTNVVTDGAATMDWNEQPKSKSIKETGVVEKGAYSRQSFTNFNGQFNSYWTSVTEIKILPLSEKPLESKDLIQYCTECGTKNKKGWKFCPTCGEKC